MRESKRRRAENNKLLSPINLKLKNRKLLTSQNSYGDNDTFRVTQKVLDSDSLITLCLFTKLSIAEEKALKNGQILGPMDSDPELLRLSQRFLQRLTEKA